MKSKFWIITTLLIIASMALASCAPKTVIQTVEVQKVVEVTPTPPPAGVVKITIFVGFGTGTSPEQQAVHQELQDLYNSTHTDIQIEFLTVPWGEHVTKWTTMLAAGNSPDIALPIGVGGISEFYKGWLDLTPYIQADNYDMTRYAGATTEIHNYPGQGVLGLPLCVYPTVDFYNKDIFDAAGVEYPPHQWAAPYADGAKWDYNKLVEISKKLTQQFADCLQQTMAAEVTAAPEGAAEGQTAPTPAPAAASRSRRSRRSARIATAATPAGTAAANASRWNGSTPRYFFAASTSTVSATSSPTAGTRLVIP